MVCEHHTLHPELLRQVFRVGMENKGAVRGRLLQSCHCGWSNGCGWFGQPILTDSLPPWLARPLPASSNLQTSGQACLHPPVCGHGLPELDYASSLTLDTWCCGITEPGPRQQGCLTGS